MRTNATEQRRRSRYAVFALPTALALTIAVPVAYGQFAGADPAGGEPAPALAAAPPAGGPVILAGGDATAGQAPAGAHADDRSDTAGPPQPGGPNTAGGDDSGSSGLSSMLGSSSPLNYLEEGEVPKRTPIKTDYPTIEGLPEGVSVARQEWLSSHRLALYINSRAMPGEPIQVQLLLARDWYSNPGKKFPSVWMLDGMRATDEASGWTLHTNIEQFYADKNVNVVLPVGGTASFYTDWNEPDNGKHYKWESFLLNELPAVLSNGYRSNGQRAIEGLSMGGTAAINLAQHRPDMFNFAGSFSGYLDTTSSGMYMAIDKALSEEGFHAHKMWGPEGSQRWIDNDPKLGIEALNGKTVYVSAGNGRDDYGQAGSVAQGPANEAGKGLEVIARMTSESFARRAEKVPGVNLVTKFRPSGVHAWPYWQFEMAQAWPYVADSLGLDKDDRGSNCTPVGAIAELTASGAWGNCVNDEYDVPGGKAEDFRGGQAFWSPQTGAHMLIGRIGARYNEIGGPGSFLGFPTTNEMITPDGQGRFVHFENGSIYWSPSTGAWEIPADMFGGWAETGYESGDIGYPVAEPKELNGSWIQQFQGGYVIRTPHPEEKIFWSKGLIARKYGEIKASASPLGAPVSNEIVIEGGALQQFEHGNIYWSPMTGAQVVLEGAIFDHWGSTGYEKGKFGWPVADQEPIAAGGVVQRFEHGTISQLNGQIVEEMS